MTYLTTAQAATALGISRRTVQWLITTGVLPARRLGRDWHIREADLKLRRVRERAGPGRPRRTA